MSIIKEKIRYNGKDSSIKINIGGASEFIGYQQEIDNLTNNIGIELVNPANDVEKRKYKLDPAISLTRFRFDFNDMPFFTDIGFTLDEIINNAKSFANSFFILDFYNDYNPYTQTKIFTTYITKLGIYPIYVPYYPVSSNTSQIYYWYVPLSYINIQTSNTSTCYLKFSFYNAKTGNIIPFYNKYNVSLLTPEKLYFKAELNHVNRTWKILDTVDYFVHAISFTTSSAYTDRINGTYEKYENVEQTYPAGNSYDYKTNKYVNISSNDVT